MVKVSIIIPVYNAEKKVSKCIDSLLNQTLPEIEIVCVDDCSTDGSGEILKAYANRDSRVKLFNNPENMGTFSSRKRGVLEASGEYIMFADNDDCYEIDACEKLYEEISRENVDILMYEVNTVSDSPEDNEIEKKQWDKKLALKEECIHGEHCHKIENRMTWLWNRIIRAEVCKKAFAFAEDERLIFVEDAYGSWLLHYFAKSYKTTKGAYYNYNIETGTSNKRSFTFEEFKNKCDEFKSLEKLLREMFEAFGELEENKWALDYEYNRGLKVCCTYWHSKVDEEDAVRVLDYIFERYEREDVIHCLHEKMHNLAKRRDSLLLKNDQLKEKNRQLRESKSMKIGKAITTLGGIR